MRDRSNIDLLVNATTGVNLGVGDCIFKCKDITGNTLQFKTISVAGGLSIIATGDTIIFSGGTGGGAVVSGTTNFIPKFNALGNNLISSSILDSGTTNIYISKNNLIIGSGIITPVRIQAFGTRKMELIASGGVAFGTTGKTLCSNGTTLCSTTYDDLCIGAGSTLSGVGKILKLNGGDGSTIGGNVVICGGAGSSIGRIQTPNLPAKSTETCAVYIDSTGNLSKGIVSTGNTTITGTANYVAKFNIVGNNVINSSIFDSGTTNICISKDNIIVGNPSNINSVIIKAHDHPTYPINLTIKPGTCLGYVSGHQDGYLYLDPGRGTPYHAIYLGSNTYDKPNVFLTPAGTTTNMGLWLCAKNSGTLGLWGDGGIWIGTSTNYLAIVGDCFSKQTHNDFCILGSDTSAISTNACSLFFRGGNANGATSNGGNLILRSGTGTTANGRIQLCGLPSSTVETCVVFIDANGKLSSGIPAGGGGLTVAVTGATNGVCLYNSKNVCLGGTLSGAVTLTAPTVSDSFNLCSINGSCNNKTIIGSGAFSTCSNNAATAFCGCILDCGQITLTSKNTTICNYVDITPNYGTLGNASNFLCATATNIVMYNMSGTACLNTVTIGGTQMQAFSADPVAGKFAMTTWSSVTPSVCISAVNPSSSVNLCVMPNAFTIHSFGVTTFPGVQYTDDCSANYTARSLVDCGYVNTTFAPKASPTFTGTITAPVIKLTTGAAAGCVLTSAVDGTASWSTPSAGGISWNNTTANGIGVYVNPTTICPNPSLTFSAGNFTVLGTVTASDFILSSDERLKTCIEAFSIAPINIEYKQFNYICEPKQLRYGVIAQELQLFNPELVKVGSDGMLGVSY